MEESTAVKGELLSAMLRLATVSHHGQFDKGGKPYILHPLAVMQLLKTDDEELQCIALGHDLIEDTTVSYDELCTTFGSRVADGIQALSKRKGETFDDYKARVIANPDAIRVKIADLTHNSDIRRLKGITEKDVNRMAKYHKFYIELAQYV